MTVLPMSTVDHVDAGADIVLAVLSMPCGKQCNMKSLIAVVFDLGEFLDHVFCG